MFRMPCRSGRLLRSLIVIDGSFGRYLQIKPIHCRNDVGSHFVQTSTLTMVHIMHQDTTFVGVGGRGMKTKWQLEAMPPDKATDPPKF